MTTTTPTIEQALAEFEQAYYKPYSGSVAVGISMGGLFLQMNEADLDRPDVVPETFCNFKVISVIAPW